MQEVQRGLVLDDDPQLAPADASRAQAPRQPKGVRESRAPLVNPFVQWVRSPLLIAAVAGLGLLPKLEREQEGDFSALCLSLALSLYVSCLLLLRLALASLGHHHAAGASQPEAGGERRANLIRTNTGPPPRKHQQRGVPGRRAGGGPRHPGEDGGDGDG